MGELLHNDKIFFLGGGEWSINYDWVCDFVENLLGRRVAPTVQVDQHLPILNHPVEVYFLIGLVLRKLVDPLIHLGAL